MTTVRKMTTVTVIHFVLKAALFSTLAVNSRLVTW